MHTAERSLLEIIGRDNIEEIIVRCHALRMACEVILYHSQWREPATVIAARRAWMVFESAVQIQQSRST